uniref:Medium-chain acyl-CoA ligase ACSF2, mitochondrial n=2 Tax=Cacopsylla melanoneura TaxID=428564 RepID=A0A8D8TUM9_9HEMI
MNSKLLRTTRTSVIYYQLSHNNFSYVHGASNTKFLHNTIAQLVDTSVEKYGSQESCVDVKNNVRLTFEQVNSKANDLASGLLSLGFKPGDRLGLWGPNSAQWQITSLAACKAGLIMVDLNPAYQSQEVLNCIKKVQIKGIVTDESFKTQNYYNLVKAVLPEIDQTPESSPITSQQCPYFTHLIVNSDKQFKGAFRLQDVAVSGNKDSQDIIHKVLKTAQPDDGCLIQFTSGTTGIPKAALLSHFNIVNNSYLGALRLNFDKTVHRICVQVPYFHVFGHVYGILTNIIFGSTLVNASPTFDGAATMAILDKEKVSVIYGTPTMHADVVYRASQLSEEERRTKFATVDYVISGGASISKQLMKQLHETLGLKKSICAYGMTETSPATFMAQLNETGEKKCYDTVGYIMDHTEAKVVDQNGRVVPFGTAGELLIRGYCNMLGYWEDEQKTKDTIGPDRWLRTGDQFILTSDGYGQVVGRMKDLIIRGGENIYPLEIEEFIQTHSDVLEAYAYGIADERMGEEVGISIKLKENAKLNVDDIKAFCKGKIAHFKIPIESVTVANALS